MQIKLNVESREEEKYFLINSGLFVQDQFRFQSEFYACKSEQSASTDQCK